MEIIKHGKTYEAPQVKVCPYCECLFTYVEKDIKENWVRESAYDSDLMYTYINCPECGKTIIIKDFRKINKVMKLWIARDKDGLIYLYMKKPTLIEWYFDTKYLIGEIDKTSFPEITFENGPQQVEIKLVKEE